MTDPRRRLALALSALVLGASGACGENDVERGAKEGAKEVEKGAKEVGKEAEKAKEDVDGK